MREEKLNDKVDCMVDFVVLALLILLPGVPLSVSWWQLFSDGTRINKICRSRGYVADDCNGQFRVADGGNVVERDAGARLFKPAVRVHHDKLRARHHRFRTRSFGQRFEKMVADWRRGRNVY
jgi:hypothetical protein